MIKWEEYVIGTLEEIYQLGGIVFLAFIIISGNYWSTAERWADRLEGMSVGEEYQRIIENRNKAELLFRFCTFMALFAIILIILSVYSKNEKIHVWCKKLMILPLVGMILLCLIYISGFYFVSID